MYTRKEKGNENQDEHQGWHAAQVVTGLDLSHEKFERKENDNENQDEHQSWLPEEAVTVSVLRREMVSKATRFRPPRRSAMRIRVA
jgi:hypothetical protein